MIVIAPLLLRAAAGAIAAAVVALGARRAGALATSGAIAATVVGTAAVAAGCHWGALLVVYFVVSSLLSRLGAARKAARTASIVDKHGPRDAVQVVANGGLFAYTALITTALPGRAAEVMTVAALGALAAATADTWATEIGTLLGGTPRSLLTQTPVPPGTSGGVSRAGSLAAIAGAAFVALAARALGLSDEIGPVIFGGVVGAFADSLVGEAWQERRWCATCERGTERLVHDCGSPTTHAGGLAWLDNDAVNLSATFVGAVMAALVSLSL